MGGGCDAVNADDLGINRCRIGIGVVLRRRPKRRKPKRSGFIALVGTLSVVPAIPLAGMALILGIDRFMSGGRAIVNIIGNAVAANVMAKLEGELDTARMRDVLDGRLVENYPVGGDAEAAPGSLLPAPAMA